MYLVSQMPTLVPIFSQLGLHCNLTLELHILQPARILHVMGGHLPIRLTLGLI
jgi:hypothetical protein